mgnify:CR=1 FL=1
MCLMISTSNQCSGRRIRLQEDLSTEALVGEQNGYDLQIAEFMQSLKEGTEPPTATLASSLISATIAEAERASIAQGRRIEISS